MDQTQALAIVRSLANGVDPETGEVFAPESAYQRPQIVRALYQAAAALERIERFERRRQQMPQKTGEPWTEEEDRKLLAAIVQKFASGPVGVTALAAVLPEEVETIEDSILNKTLDHENVDRLYLLRRDLLRLRNAAWPLLDVCQRIAHVEAFAIDAAMQPNFRDVTDHVRRVKEEIDKRLAENRDGTAVAEKLAALCRDAYDFDVPLEKVYDRVYVNCNKIIPNGFAINYAIFNNPAYGES